MSIVSDILLSYLSGKQKQTPSGWLAVNAPCCIHNGESADTRNRGGIIQEGDVMSYHCFNCGYKASWQPGRHISYNLRKLFEWFNVPDDIINKVALEVLKINEGIEVTERILNIPEFSSVQLPENAIEILDDPCDTDQHSLAVKDYMASRQLWLNDGYKYFWSPKFGYRDRLIIPFYYQKRIVGWTARTIAKDKNPKYLTESQPGFVYGLDEQGYNKLFAIVVEGPIDAIHIDGCALLRSEINDQQAYLLNRLNRDIIILPDRDRAGSKLVEQAIDRGWQVSMPDWEPGIKDVNDCVNKHGKLYTLYSIVNAAESSPLKIRLRAKKWFG